MNWQKIETAPKDKTAVLVWDGNIILIATYYQKKYWLFTNSAIVLTVLTHWMPLPEPPKEG